MEWIEQVWSHVLIFVLGLLMGGGFSAWRGWRIEGQR